MIEERGTGRSSSTRWFPPPSILWALAIALVVGVVYVSRDFVVILFLSATLAYLINPIVKIAESVAIKRAVAVTVIYLGIGIGIFVLAYFFLPRLRVEVDSFYQSVPSFGERLDAAIDTVQDEIGASYPAARGLLITREVRYSKLNAFIEQQAMNLPGILSHLALLVLAIVLVPFFSYFLLRDSRKIIQFILNRLPATHIETSVAIWSEIDRIVGHYLRGVAIEGIVIGVSAALGLWVLGINYPLLLGILSGAANVVPYLGPILGGAAAVLAALVQFESLGPVAKVLTLYVSLKLLDVIAIQPLAVGDKNLHPMLLIASVIVGGHALGIIGMVIAVPTVTILQEIAKLLLERRSQPGQMAEVDVDKSVRMQPYIC
ncbi:MAG TPA: AI-2E family transporter [Candidatus Binatia bacterium]|jgi:predicted PurR-regulated permease PerM|nr:AI-2E family transporter [Candidatus Binatia bacterium]